MEINNELHERLLRYLLKKTLPHQYKFNNTDECADFITDIFSDVLMIETSEERLKNIIDLAASSITKTYDGIFH